MLGPRGERAVRRREQTLILNINGHTSHRTQQRLPRDQPWRVPWGDLKWKSCNLGTGWMQSTSGGSRKRRTNRAGVLKGDRVRRPTGRRRKCSNHHCRNHSRQTTRPNLCLCLYLVKRTNNSKLHHNILQFFPNLFQNHKELF